MTATIISRPTINVSENLTPELHFEQGRLLLHLRAHRDIRVLELQGPKSFLRAYGLAMPANFVARWFADDADVPATMMDDVAFVNQVDFRWGCDIAIAANADQVIRLPTAVTTPQPIDLGIIHVVYEYTLLFGLVRRTYSASIAVGSRENRNTVEQPYAA